MLKISILRLFAACLAVGSFTAFSAFGQLDAASEEALKKTKELLQNPQALKGPAGNADEKAALAEVDRIFKNNPKGAQQVNELSAQIFEKMVRENDGDPAAVFKTLSNAQKDPKAFFQTLSPAQQAQIQSMAKNLEAKK